MTPFVYCMITQDYCNSIVLTCCLNLYTSDQSYREYCQAQLGGGWGGSCLSRKGEKARVSADSLGVMTPCFWLHARFQDEAACQAISYVIK